MKPLPRTRRSSPFEGIPPQIFVISQTPYGYLHHRAQRIANQLCDWGMPVTYIEEHGGWRPYLSGQRGGFARALGRSLKYHLYVAVGGAGGTKRASRDGPVERKGGRKVKVLETPLIVPTTRFNSASLERLAASLFRQVLLREVFPQRDQRLRSVALVNSPIWGIVIRKGDFDRVVYDCIDDVSLYAGLSSLSRFQGYEQQLLQVSDAVVTTAASLEARLRSLSPKMPVTRIPNGVDVGWFQECAAEGRVPPDIAALPHPVVGYVGTISGWMNITLAAEVARLLPDITFVFVGPEDPWVNLEALKRLPNVHFLGRKPYEDVPAAIAACRVCWIPFSTGKIVEGTNPIKLFEYFALGKPVVSTPMPELEPFHRDGLLAFGSTAEELAKAIRKALAEEDEHKPARRAGVASEHSWESLIAKLLQVLRGEGETS